MSKLDTITSESVEHLFKLMDAGIDAETASHLTLIHYFVAMAKQEGLI